jgi:hypothetical protein
MSLRIPQMRDEDNLTFNSNRLLRFARNDTFVI